MMFFENLLVNRLMLIQCFFGDLNLVIFYQMFIYISKWEMPSFFIIFRVLKNCFYFAPAMECNENFANICDSNLVIFYQMIMYIGKCEIPPRTFCLLASTCCTRVEGLIEFDCPGKSFFRYCMMLFGLHNASATWQLLIAKVLEPALEPFVFVHVDDSIVVASVFEEHRRILKVVLDFLRRANLRPSLDKCQFCRSELKFL